MSMAYMRNGSRILCDSTGKPLRTDWSTWPATLTINAANSGITALGGTIGYWGSRTATKSVTPFFYDTPAYKLSVGTTDDGYMAANLTLKLSGSQLFWVIDFMYFLVTRSSGAQFNGNLFVKRDIVPTSASAIGSYTFVSYAPAPGAFNYTSPWSVSA